MKGSANTIRTEAVLVDSQIGLVSQKMKGSANTIRTEAVLVDSQIGLVSQKTVDLLVEMSTPFVEDAVQLLLHRGIPVSSLFQFPTKNELLVVQGKFLRLETDIDFPMFLYYSTIA
ncbi:hypothetical protein COOONC_04263 [Cooperia oncophora]